MQLPIQDPYKLKGKKVAILGFGKSGFASAKLLSRFDAKLIINDCKKEEELLSQVELVKNNIQKVYAGHHTLEVIENVDLVVVSPGVPLSIPILVSAVYKGLPVIGEIELSYQILKFFKEDIKIIGITGSNGKSTTSTLVYEFLRKDEKNVQLAGNIGNPLAEVVLKLIDKEITIDYLVVELSSFQLESIKSFKPDFAAILNITADHMDRYSSMKEYIEAKVKIFMNQSKEDYLVLNIDDKSTPSVVEHLKKLYLKRSSLPHIFYFSRLHKVYGAYLEGELIYFEPREDLDEAIRGEMKKTVLNTLDFKIKGVHNIENVMAASLLALLSGCKGQALKDVLEKFTGLPHRMEFVRVVDGVSFINDSKGTNVDAVRKSLESLNNVILIAGGRDKDGDFESLKDVVKDRVKTLILIGEAKEKIAKALGDVVSFYFEEDMKSAVIRAKSIAKPGDTVLLSPGCASFDMFKNFEHRGDVFKEIVNSL
ncbi:MAG: UDP-N-acetylmuramoyl-L-alanine--D-glutamate ligase [Thermodesulfovibrionaceae bacterium]